jgi:hypothetical protein
MDISNQPWRLRDVSAGLKRMLELIRSNPQDTLLVDRFLVLASDLSDDEKADLTLGLSEALLRKNPRRAIEVAHMLYRARPSDHQPLQIMVEGFENLGRYGKATVLRQHLENVKKARATNPGHVEKVVQESIVAIDRELMLLSQQPAAQSVKIEEPKKIVSQQAKTSIAKPPPQGQDDDPLATDKKTFYIDPANKIAALHPDESQKKTEFFPQDREDSPVNSPFDEPSTEKLSNDQKQASASSSSSIMGMPRLEVPYDFGIAKYRDSYEWMEAMGTPPRDADEPSKRSAKASPKNEPPLKQESSPEETFMAYVEAKNWEGLLHIIQTYWPSGAPKSMIPILAKLQIGTLDLNFLAFWLDTLLLNHRPRQAFLCGYKVLTDHPFMGFAKIVAPRLSKAAKHLGWKPLHWQEKDGVIKLLNTAKLQNMATPRTFVAS